MSESITRPHPAPTGRLAYRREPRCTPARPDAFGVLMSADVLTHQV